MQLSRRNKPLKIRSGGFFVSLRSCQRGQHLHKCPSQGPSCSQFLNSTWRVRWRIPLGTPFMWHRHGPKLIPGLSPDLGLWEICKPDILGPSFKRIQAVGKGWIFMWCIWDMAEWLLRVLSCHQAPWGPSTARNLGDMSHGGGGMLPSKMPSAGIRSDTELLYWDMHSTAMLRSTWWPLKLPFGWSWVAEMQIVHQGGEGSLSQWRVYNKWRIAPTGHYNLIFWVPGR